MNATNFTEAGDLVPLLEIEAEDESVDLGLIESSVLKVIPKFFRAIATLLISGLLLGVTFLLITLWKRGCRTHRKLEEDKATNGRAGSPLHSVVVTPPTTEDDPDVDDASRSTPPSSSLQPIRSKHMKVPKQHNLRRASGPFGSEALSFAVEQYTMKHLEKEVHLHHHHHGHGHSHSPNPHGGSQQHIRSGASNAGGDPALEHEGESKSRWNCFKGSKE